ALQHASDAAAGLEALLPRVGSLGTVFKELESLILNGHRASGAASGVPGVDPVLMSKHEPVPNVCSPTPTIQTLSGIHITPPNAIASAQPIPLENGGTLKPAGWPA